MLLKPAKIEQSNIYGSLYKSDNKLTLFALIIWHLKEIQL